MTTKLFAIHDRGTFIPVLAVRFNPATEAERELLFNSGYHGDQSKYLMLAQIYGGHGWFTIDQSDWQGARTMPTAHKFIAENWDTLESTAVIDVEVILGEKKAPEAIATVTA